MTPGDFESNLDDYIEERRASDRRRQRRGFFKRLFGSWRRQERQDDRSEKEAELEEIEDDIEVIDEEEQELEEVREGLLTRFFKLLRSSSDDSASDVADPVDEEDEADVVVEPEPEMVDKETVKEVVKIQHRWIEELPAEDLSRFKRHEDYDRYTELLDELGLIEKE